MRGRDLCARVRTAVLSAVLLLVAVPAQAELTPDDLERLIQDGRFDEAYALASEHRFELEGEVMFDLLYGIAAVNSGHLSEGIFALERVVMQRPGFVRARLELARAYFLRGEDIRANHHFERALAQDPPPPVVAAIERYQQRIQARAERYRTTVRGHVEFGFGRDNNVNSATGNDTVEWVLSDVLGDIQLDDDARAQGDHFTRAGAALRLSRPINPNQTVFGRLSGDARTHDDEGAFDTTRGSVRLGTTWQGETIQTTAAIRSQRFYLDGDRYQSMNGFQLTFQRPLSAVLSGNLGVQHLRMRYPGRADRDANLTLVSTGISRLWRTRWRPLTSIGVFAGHEDALANTTGARANTDRNLYGVSAAARLQLAPQWNLTGRAQFRRSKYGGTHSTFDETRREEYTQVALDLDYAPTVNWRLGPSIQYSDNNANIDLFDYDRTVVELRARYSFN